MVKIFVLVVLVLLILALLVFLLVKNNRDRKELESQLNSDYRKTPDRENDLDEDLKQD